MSNKPIVTRFAPSPTGFLHVGGARTTLFNYLFAKQNGGKFLLRIEDTDKERSKPEFEKNILDGLKWLGLPFDNEPIKQSERTAIYKRYLKQMIDSGKAYVSKESPKEEGDRAEVIRFKNPNIRIKFQDLIRGEIEFDTTELKDFVIAKSMEEPLYHLAVVVDDFEMGITHVIRGEDHISNTPRQILIQDAIGAPRPIYAHLPLILASDRSKLSKRKHGESVSLPYYKDNGYFPEAMVNFLALLGWNPGTEQEIFSTDELVKLFDISKVQKSGAIFNIEKLNWLNREYIKKLSPEILEQKIIERLPKHLTQSDAGRAMARKITPILVDRIATFGDIETMSREGEISYFFEWPIYEAPKLLWKDAGAGKIVGNLEKTINILETVEESGWTRDSIKSALWPFAEESGRGSVLWPMRMALSGRDKSPDPFILAEIFGKHETIARLRNALQKCAGAL